ncbi:LysM peptidoglycan-binding domain-containing protein [Flavobacterium sedimenticola]|uniref:LysM peptidoglycan-binding domain-containing protein n=1 Tax=Flavobacterium sedimenticola TaxID=3043286 RepID=A0ABT6XLV3_9FLAO|nr:LysM peptidoglycan-binding domain-containing protein [Flavobacterium sedimenticola]MDI9256070.1 LysM peptidoglycan-binding domain-containing protein [Flavobacterium sedimenticola]
MIIKKITTLALMLIASVTFAQDTIALKPAQRKLTKREVLDSIKATFVHDKIAQCIDSMWMKELASLDLYNELTLDIRNINVDEKVDYELSTELLKERLKKLDEKSPFNIEYNVGLENVIKSFLKNRKRAFERLMGVSQYYFPMFEEALAAQNIPLEIKYLAVVESALNPRAVSRVGATGLWQFMYQTGKQYGLQVDTYVDDRRDPLKASNAATQYMKNMYAIFGDWDLVLASYNTGPGNVAKAIRRSGGKQNYWNIRPYLHKETQGYVPAFLATMYIFEYHKEHGIKPDRAIANHFATDTVMVKRSMTFKQLADLLDVSVAELQFLNPTYKREEIPYISGQQHFLRLPVDKIALFTSNEDKIYAYAEYESSQREKPYQGMLASRDSLSTSKVKYHKVRRGDSLSEISDRYGVTMSELKKWNRLRSNKAPLGRNLKIYTRESIASNERKSTKADTAAVNHSSDVASNSGKIFKEEKVISYKDVVKYHKVKKGDNLGEISDKYGVTVAELKKWNKLKSNNIALGANLKVIKNERVVTTVRKEVKSDKPLAETKVETAVASNDNDTQNNHEASDYYEVQKGDNLFSIAKKFNVSLEDLKKWNNLDDLNVQLGSKLALVDKEANTQEEAPVTETKIVEHKVKKGEYLGTIAKKYNVTIAEIKEWNNLEDNNVRLGETLIVSKKEVAVTETKSSKKESIAANDRNNVKLYYVKKGDSLFSIAKKYPGVTISDIKKWNGIKNESLKPGMKLKINNG